MIYKKRRTETNQFFFCFETYAFYQAQNQINIKICFIYRKILTFQRLDAIMLLSLVKINKNHDK